MAKWKFTEFRSNVPLRILARNDDGGPRFNRVFTSLITVIIVLHNCENFFSLVSTDLIVTSNAVYYVWKIFIRFSRRNINSETDILLKNQTENNCKLVCMYAKHLFSKSSVYTHMQRIYWLIKKKCVYEYKTIMWHLAYKKYHNQVLQSLFVK